MRAVANDPGAAHITLRHQENPMAEEFPGWHGTTIIGVRKGGIVVIAGDGQVSLGQTVIKGTARKVRKLSPGGMDAVSYTHLTLPTICSV